MNSSASSNKHSTSTLYNNDTSTTNLSTCSDSDDLVSLSVSEGNNDETVVLEQREEKWSDENHPYFKALNGYKLYDSKAKKDAVLNFLCLDSLSSLITSGDEELQMKMCKITEGPKRSLKKNNDGGYKLPNDWRGFYCTTLILDVVQLLQKDNTARQAAGKKNCVRHSPPVVKFLQMLDDAKEKVADDSRKKKPNKTRKEGKNRGLLLKSLPQADLGPIQVKQVEKTILCPLCNHRSIVACTTKASVNKMNKRIREYNEKKLNDWEADGKTGPKPRGKAFKSQILGCVCYLQNCIGNPDGTGCFKCKDLNGNVPLKQDMR